MPPAAVVEPAQPRVARVVLVVPVRECPLLQGLEEAEQTPEPTLSATRVLAEVEVVTPTRHRIRLTLPEMAHLELSSLDNSP